MNPKYKKNKKNQGQIPELRDERVLYVPVGCENCIECRKQKANEWKVRLNEELRKNQKGYFVTLTFSNSSIRKLSYKLKKRNKKAGLPFPEGYELDNDLANLGREYFVERFRKKHKRRPRYWLVTELGHEGTENVHWHGIIFSESKEDIKNAWGQDFLYFGYSLHEKTVNYVVKYINKIDADHKYFKPIIRCSNGIGGSYIERHDSKRNKYKGTLTDERYTNRQGYKTALPIYFRNKIYSDREKEDLWIHKLDKEVRWVLGYKIDVSQGYEEYDRAIETARAKNRRLGYGKLEDDEERKQYEHDRRKLQYLKRVHDIQSDFDIDTGEVLN